MFTAAFAKASNADFAAWCMVKTAPHCYEESAVASNGTKVLIASAGCGWPHGPPRAGPAYWTF
jgi:hypothetical protein